MPLKILISRTDPDRLARLRAISPEVEFLIASDRDEALELVPEADAAYGFCSEALIEAGTRLRWIQVGSAGVERYPFDLLKSRSITFTNFGCMLMSSD